jgi:hypothetical protein
MEREVRVLPKARDIAFRSGDPLAYSSFRANLKRGITEDKQSHHLRIEEHHYSDPELTEVLTDISLAKRSCP